MPGPPSSEPTTRTLPGRSRQALAEQFRGDMQGARAWIRHHLSPCLSALAAAVFRVWQLAHSAWPFSGSVREPPSARSRMWSA